MTTLVARIRARLEARLGPLLPDDATYAAACDAAVERGRWMARVGWPGCDGLRLGAATWVLELAPERVARVLGFGMEQGEALAALAGASAMARREAARLGALFNLGIVLFDTTCDRFPARARELVALLDAAALDRLLDAGRGAAGALDAAAVDDAALGALLTLVVEFFRGVASLGGDAVVHAELAALMRVMYRAELAAARVGRGDDGPSLAVLRALRRKSALPIRAVALVGELAAGTSTGGPRAAATMPATAGAGAAMAPTGAATAEAGAATRAARDAIVRLGGEAMWIVDDLADVVDDWRAGAWSRPWWLLARASGGPLPPGEGEALATLDARGIVDAETARLAARLERLGREAPPEGRAFAAAIGTVVRSWIEGMER